MTEHSELVVPDDFSEWIKGVPIDIRKRLSIHHFRILWEYSRKHFAKQLKDPVTKDPIEVRCPACNGQMLYESFRGLVCISNCGWKRS